MGTEKPHPSISFLSSSLVFFLAHILKSLQLGGNYDPSEKENLIGDERKKKKMPASTILTLRPHFPPQIIPCSSENSPNPLLLTLADTRARKSRKEGEKSQTDQQKGKEQVKTSPAGLGNQAEKQVKIPLENKFSFYYLSFWGGIKI